MEQQVVGLGAADAQDLEVLGPDRVGLVTVEGQAGVVWVRDRAGLVLVQD